MEAGLKLVLEMLQFPFPEGVDFKQSLKDGVVKIY